MTMRHWPLFGLTVRTLRLRLRLPSPPELDALADLAAEGVHDPAVMPFGVPWTDVPPAERARATVQYHWAGWSAWRPEAWQLNLVVVADGTVVGMQALEARDFAVVRQASTGSWIGRRHQGQGYGTEMRGAVLHLAFAELGARDATSKAFLDNPASLSVSRKLGYEPDGVFRQERRGRPATQQRLRLTREAWERHRPVPVTVEGLAPCLPLFGAV
jgi:RimJ/RimL family protein N-acetyltransferase